MLQETREQRRSPTARKSRAASSSLGLGSLKESRDSSIDSPKQLSLSQILEESAAQQQVANWVGYSRKIKSNA